jgi:hypothetical protein
MARATPRLLLSLLAACSGTATGDGADGGIGADAAARTPDGRIAAQGVSLLETTWTLPPHVERYLCVRKTVTEDVYIGRFAPIAPVGTHHTVLTIDDNGGQPDGVVVCNATVSAPRMIYGSGVGTDPLEMPPGVAMRVRAGQQLLLNLHLYNTDDAPLSGTSGVEVDLLDPTAVTTEAEAILAGTINLLIPPGMSTLTGRCTTPGAVRLFGVGAHMHRLGIHQKVTVERTGQVLRDRPYSFDTQDVDDLDVSLDAGDRVRVDCTFANDTGGYVTFGESTDAEMCFAILFRYPAQGTYHICLN